ncbi:hypothetical protein QEH52_12060 [Coraliomargarita sp. SDUM461003]|uniref:Uncharacterized protein n=1 Tax=Thalassobacterium maritimum TaxID=3041265 RepID=A0ABU1AVZ0_9BACT|nr:hypothetical protein [Coraliomargarita sp. SDUM461003]MDQ8208248.1 hypothetical protein [Coraliomargarita sp. SDUM461003]
MHALIRQSYDVLLLILCMVSASSFAETYVLDFSKSDSADVVFNSELETRDLGIEFKHALPSGTYEIVLDRSNRFIIPVDRGRLRVENDNKEEISNIQLITPILNIEEGDALTEAFHNAFDLPLSDYYKWSQPARENKYLSDFYAKDFKDNYPRISMSVHSSYNKDIPFYVTYQFSWNNGLHRRRGTSAESNTLENFTFDVPAILASVSSKRSEPPAIEKPKVQEAPALTEQSYEEKKPFEVIFDEVETPTEPIEEPTEPSSNWWLWLIGVLVVVGGLGLVLRRKN